MKDIIEFPRSKDYKFEKSLGQGACGLTVLLHDPTIDEKFVCKKYAPIYEEYREELFVNFIREIKFLYKLNHPNIVRVFNYYLYPDKKLGYIIMEYIQGCDIYEYLKEKPENINEIFNQVISGFCHLEQSNILHRDIRPLNILVGDDGIAKIIDFGFGKSVDSNENFDKSISLNWWCETPIDFDNSIYDFSTEVYFVGKLFEKIILEVDIQDFKFKNILQNMCKKDPDHRIKSFIDIQKELFNNKFSTIDFDYFELTSYRKFASSFSASISKVEYNIKFHDVDKVQQKLEDCYKRVMLETEIPSAQLLIDCLLNGAYYFKKNYLFKVDTLKSFIDLLRQSSKEKKNIIISNLQSRIDAVEHYSTPDMDFDADIPF